MGTTKPGLHLFLSVIDSELCMQFETLRFSLLIVSRNTLIGSGVGVQGER